MGTSKEILLQNLREQFALKEHLCKVIQDQISMIDPAEFSDAKKLLQTTNKTLEDHFSTLSKLLDTWEDGETFFQKTNGAYVAPPIAKEMKVKISQRFLLDTWRI